MESFKERRQNSFKLLEGLVHHLLGNYDVDEMWFQLPRSLFVSGREMSKKLQCNRTSYIMENKDGSMGAQSGE